MSHISLCTIDSMLDDFRDSIEEFINICGNDDRCDLIVDTAQQKITDVILEIEHEIELLHILDERKETSTAQE